MGRLTIKADTGEAHQHDFIYLPNGAIGVVRRAGWVIVYGPTSVRTVSLDPDARERIMSKARKHWQQRHLPRHLRDHGYGPPSPDESAEDFD